jgi:dUTPase-like protein
MDRLEDMLTSQLKLQQDLGYDFTKMSIAERIQFIKDMMLAAQQELGEALNEVSWKPWTVGERFNTTAFTSELGDVFQFIMNMWFVALPCLTPTELAEAMRDTLQLKLIINRKRHAEGYDGVNTKCPHCTRALDDVGVVTVTDSFGVGIFCNGCGNATNRPA